MTPSSNSVVEPPRDVAPGTYWALVKVMYFGRRVYTRSVPVSILASPAVRALVDVDPATGRRGGAG